LKIVFIKKTFCFQGYLRFDVNRL